MMCASRAIDNGNPEAALCHMLSSALYFKASLLAEAEA